MRVHLKSKLTILDRQYLSDSVRQLLKGSNPSCKENNYRAVWKCFALECFFGPRTKILCFGIEIRFKDQNT